VIASAGPVTSTHLKRSKARAKNVKSLINSHFLSLTIRRTSVIVIFPDSCSAHVVARDGRA
jgi:hypothetical protein